MPIRTWQDAWQEALYGTGGFYRRPGGPVEHFRTSVHASGLMAEAVLRLLERLDQEMNHPEVLDLVDLGAGRGELLLAAAARAQEHPALAERLRMTGVDLVSRPDGLPQRIAWRNELPTSITGLLFAHEWLDNVACPVVEQHSDGTARTVLVDSRSGHEQLGRPLAAEEQNWLNTWWPLAEPRTRAEIGLPRDLAWTGALSSIESGVAIAVDYGHLRGGRPPFGSLAGFTSGRSVDPVPDGSCDLTAQVAFDAIQEAGQQATGAVAALLRQRQVLHALGIEGRRPPRDLASADPAAYLRALALAGEAGELTDRSGLGSFYWLLQPVSLAKDWSKGLTLTSTGPAYLNGYRRT
jgi:SAM-dependent MidA family methyltransferase